MILVFLFLYTIEAGQMEIIKDTEEIVKFSGGVVVRDSGLEIKAPGGYYLEKEDRLILTGKATACMEGKTLEAKEMHIENKGNILKSYGNVIIKEGEKVLRADSVYIENNLLKAFDNAVFYNKDENIEVKGNYIESSRDKAIVKQNPIIRILRKDTVCVTAQEFVLKEKSIEGYENVSIITGGVEAQGNYLFFDRKKNSGFVCHNVKLKWDNGNGRGDTLKFFLNKNNELEYLIICGNGYIESSDKKGRIYIESPEIWIKTEQGEFSSLKAIKGSGEYRDEQ